VSAADRGGQRPEQPLAGRRICMFVFNDCSRDSRVLKEASSLAAAGAIVTIVARTAPGIPDHERRAAFTIERAAPGSLVGFSIRVLRKLSRGAGFLWAVLGWSRAARHLTPAADAYHGHDLTGLIAAWLATRRQRGSDLVYDSHELFLEAGSVASLPAMPRRLLARLEGALARRASAIVTVNPSIGAELVERYRVAQPVAVMNCPPRWRPEESEPPVRDRFREVLPIPPGQPIVLYQGGFTPHRGIEPMVRALVEPELRSAAGVFLGYGPMRDWLLAEARRPELAGRMHVLDAVPPDELVEWTASADVTGAPIERINLNHWYSTPNKMFESMAAGVPFVSSDFPERGRIIRETGAGVLCDPTDIGSVARAFASVLSLSPQERLEFRRRCRRAALERYNWETESARLVELYSRLLGGGPPSERQSP
jgi:glycosyltransferase involved in cell wall biosynthesis